MWEWHKNRLRNQWNKIKIPKVNLVVWSKAQRIHSGEGQSVETMLGDKVTTWKRMSLDPCQTTNTKPPQTGQRSGGRVEALEFPAVDGEKLWILALAMVVLCFAFCFIFCFWAGREIAHQK